jgi:nitric oxide reductase subunit B
MNGVRRRRNMVISPLWLQGAILTIVASFAVMAYLAVTIYHDRPPIPDKVVDPARRAVFTGADVRAGQGVFEKYGLMEQGSIFGHGAYLGPDFTAEYLHAQVVDMAKQYGPSSSPQGVTPEEQVARRLHQNRYSPDTGVLAFTDGQASAFDSRAAFYTARFNSPKGADIVPPAYIGDPM